MSTGGEDDFNEIIVISSDSEDEEPISHGNEIIVISSDSEGEEPISHGNEIIVISSDSEDEEPISHANEIIVISSDSEDEEPISHANEIIVISSDSEDEEPISHANEIIVISSDSEEEEPISHTNEIIVISSDSEEEEQTGRGEKRKAGNQNMGHSEDDDLTPSKKRKVGNQNVFLSEDDDPIPNVSDERLEHEQTGRGVKRKAENQYVEQEQDYYQIKPIREHHSQKFNMTAKNYSVHFNNTLDDVNLLESRDRTYGIFQHLLEDVTKDMNPKDQVRFVLRSDQLQSAISMPFCSLEELTVEKVLSTVEKVVQSNEEFRLNDMVNIDLIRVEMPQGSGRSKRTTLNIRDYLKKKRSVILINNKDDLCLARALAVSIARIEQDPQYGSIAKSNRPLQRERAYDLHEAANVPLGPCGLKEVDLFQQHLVNYQIIVVSGDQGNAIIYPPHPWANPNPEKSIYLYYQANHFDVITTLPGFLNKSYFCHRCHKGYDVTTDHLCKGMCRSCRGFGCVIQDNGVTCNECKRLFMNQVCYDRHKQEPIDGGGGEPCAKR